MNQNTLHSQDTFPKKTKSKRKQAGIALMTVLFASVLLGLLAFEFSYDSRLELTSAQNVRDRTQAEYLARSATELGQLVVAIHERDGSKIASLSQDMFRLIDFSSMLTQAFSSRASETNSISIPLGMPDFGEYKSPKNTTMELQITTEDDRYPLNCSGGLSPQASNQAQLHLLLMSLFQPQIFQPFFDRADAHGLFITRDEFARSVIDWMDVDTVKFDPAGPGSQQEEGYDRGTDVYFAHNHHLDTMAELRLIHGMRPELYPVMEDVFTIYGPSSCKVSAKNIKSPLLMAAILAASTGDPKTVYDPNTVAVAERITPLLKFIKKLESSPEFSKVIEELKQNPCPEIPGNTCKAFGDSSGEMSTLESLICNPKLDMAINQITSKVKSDMSLNPLMSVFAPSSLTKDVKSLQALRPIALCPGALSSYLSSGDSSTKIYRFKASGIVHAGQVNVQGESKARSNPTQVRFDGVWNSSLFLNNPICFGHPNCNRNGGWAYAHME